MIIWHQIRPGEVQRTDAGVLLHFFILIPSLHPYRIAQLFGQLASA